MEAVRESRHWAPNLSVYWYPKFVAEVRVMRGPHNFFDVELIRDIGAAYEMLGGDPDVRCVVLASEGRNFCAGADFRGVDASRSATPPNDEEHLYDAAARLLVIDKPVVALLQGKSVGGGVGLAMTADFRVGGHDVKLAANFSQLGSHHGFGLSSTLSSVIGHQRSLEMLVTGRWIEGEEALAWRLVDRLAPAGGSVRDVGLTFAREVSAAAPLAVRAILETMRADRLERFRTATRREKAAQEALFPTLDRAEGVRASLERRPAHFVGA